MNVFDASALLAYLQGEPGADVVKEALLAGGHCSAANWSEVAQKVRSRGHGWSRARALLLGYDFTVVSVTVADAESAAALWQSGSPLSLGDRLCVALAERLDATVWTADAAWGAEGRIRQIR